ncbi:hypothetical protein M011DRAFT_335665 [Sporormia fimetaria CBS 119925]|uniref:Uncharacterized protein n=1 Tax=Sporormia fimetaria CBS 119925 TaxID=1340428 RepID=A0A6A6VHY2_9PLEO|nr:hypothetical protein M011DRAFT_335665 [Sporormia fimetaria CBS 119925]
MAKLTAELEETKKSNLNQSKTNTDLTLAIEKLANLEKEKASLLKTNQDQKKQIDSLERDAVQSEKLSTAFEQEAKAKMQQLEDRAVELELENSDLMKQITSLQKKTSIVSVGQANGNSGNGNSALVEALKAQVQESEIERKQLSESLEQWQLLAKVRTKL